MMNLMGRTVALMLTLLAWVAPAAADQTIRLTFTGDVTLGCEEALRGQEAALPYYAETYGDAYFFQNMQTLFEADDLTVANLEGVLSDSSEGENKNKTYRFRGAASYAQILSGSSIEMVNLANNHTYDYGEGGYADTEAALDAAGVAHFGGHETAWFEKSGLRIAFVGLSYSEENKAEREWMQSEITRLKSEEGAAAVVFVYHGGQEYSEARTQKQTEIARLAVDAGADLVIMHHPHVVQGINVLSNRSVCYSLGNFCFGGNKRVRALQSLVVVAELTFSDEGEYLGQQLSLYPAHVSGTTSYNNYQPLLVSGTDARRVMKLVQADTRFTLNPYDEEFGYALQDYLPAQVE